MLKVLIPACFFLTTCTLVAQRPGAPAPAQAACSEDTACGIEQLPSEATVRSFLDAMYGPDAKAEYKLLSIKWSSTVPGTPVVIVSVGIPAKVQEFYITPDRQHAIVGKVVPFGADPFRFVRDLLRTRALGPARGQRESALVLVEFSDLECPACKQVQPLINQVVAAHPEARFVYESFPLSFHPWAQKAAAYAQCIAEVDGSRFFDFVDAIYEKQEAINASNADELLSRLAKQEGTDEVALSRCSTNADVTRELAASMQLGHDIDVTATPTLFVNGRKLLVGGMSFDELNAIVSYESAQARDARHAESK
jgi:protein-disulfide isomerase